ncbi:MAG TPA: hypothetical protein VGS18_00310, partial [Thermoplasmata archaeon]|nr:hypothetical protein [Thermoplasmata archaeon]
HDILFVNTTGGTTAFITIIGNYDTLNIPTTGGSVIHIYLVGNNDPIFQGSTGGTVVTVSAWGSHDAFNSTTTGGANIAVQYTGFNATNPISGICPYGNLSNTDTVSQSHSGGGTFNVTFNNTGYGANGSGGGWAEQWQKVNGLNCPFFTTVTVPLRNSGAVGASFVVHLRNTYAPVGEVAFDQGAVIFAQAGGTPIVVDGPALSFHSGKLSLFVPEFQGQIGSEVGTSTASLSLRLISAIPLVLPQNGYSLKSGSTVLLTVVSPYAAAWMAYFTAQPGLSGLATCTGPASACVGPFNFGGPLGKVTLAIPATALSLVVGTYSIALS